MNMLDKALDQSQTDLFLSVRAFGEGLSPEAKELIRKYPEVINDKLASWIQTHNDLSRGIEKEVMNYYNEVRKKYKSKNGSKVLGCQLTYQRRKLILARVKEGQGIMQFCGVINHKFKQWYGTDYEIHLKPETLFSTKFTKYLEEARDAFNKVDGNGDNKKYAYK